MNNIFGPPVHGNDFLFRERELKHLIHVLKQGNSVLLTGLRRIGKSSLLKEANRVLQEEKSIHPILLDCESYEEPARLFVEILDSFPNDKKSFWEKNFTFLPDVLRNIKAIKAQGVGIEFNKTVGDYWTPTTKAIAKLFEKCKEDNQQIVLLLDELPLFLENLKDRKHEKYVLQQILTTLREWRNAGMPMVLCGSINLRFFLNAHDISEKFLSGCTELEINPLTNKEAKRFLQKLLESIPVKWWTEEVTEQILEITPDNIPFFLQCIFSHMSIEERLPKDLEAFYNDHIFKGLYKDFIYQFEERILKYEKKDREKAYQILDIIAKEENLDPNKTDDRILQKLVTEEFLKREKGSYSFSLKLIRDWWKEKRNLK